MTRVWSSNESKYGTSSCSTLRKVTKLATFPLWCCLRKCRKTLETLVNIHKNSRGLRCLSRWLLAIVFPMFLLYFIPLLLFYSPDVILKKSFNLRRTFEEIIIAWSTLLLINPWYVVVVSSLVGFSLARESFQSNQLKGKYRGLGHVATSGDGIAGHSISEKMMISFVKICGRPEMKKRIYVLATAIPVIAIVGIQTNLQMLYPSWIWNPLLLRYKVYEPSDINSSMAGLCVEDYLTNSGQNQQKPLCLSEKSWRELSTGVLSSRNDDDTTNVLNGVKYLKNQSGGIIFAIMARDTIDAIQPLRKNVESMLPFTSNLAVIVFENDSNDGTRQEFLKWSKDVEGQYIVDLIECEDSPGCVFNESHRDLMHDITYEKTSAIGRMGEFRQRVVDHILKDTKYSDYSHFLVLDIDLSVSISPFGIIHSLGVQPDDAVASSGRQARPGSFGSLAPPYDFSAFVPFPSHDNERMRKLNEKLCGLKPKGYRWRNECTAISVAQFMMIETEDKFNEGKPYLVRSAFNGAVLYPIKLVRESKAKYDSGDDGQRCEHIGFNLSLKNGNMYINPKWNMHLHPHRMGGPSGKRALRIIKGITSSPKIVLIAFGQNVVSTIIFVYSIITLTMHIGFPLWVYISRAVIYRSALKKKTATGVISVSLSMKEIEILLDPNQDFFSPKQNDDHFDKDQCNQVV